MRFLHVIPFFSPKMGGSAMVAYHMARHLGERGHEVTVITSDHGLDEVPFETGPFEVVYLPCIAHWGFYLTPSLLAWARNNVVDHDLVHMHELRTFQNAVVGYYAARHGVPYVISAHGTLPVIVERKRAKRLYDRIAGKRLLASAACLIAVSPYEVGQLRDAGIEEERIRVVFNGLDLDAFAELPPRGILRHRFGIPSKAPAILFLGRLHRRKCIDHLIQAFAVICSQLKEARLLIVGPDEGEEARLQSLVEQLALNESVIFAGPLYDEDKLSAYVDADLLVSPAVHEIFGLVPFEAIMCGTPVIIANDCGSGQMIEEAEAGYLVPSGDTASLVAAIQHVLTHESAAQEKVKSGQAYVTAQFGDSAIITRLEELYAELTAK